MNRFLSQSVVLLLLLAVPTTQADTHVRLTRLQIASVTGNAVALLDQIDLQDQALVQENSELAQVAAAAPAGKREARVLRRLERKVPRAERLVQNRVADLSDEEVAAELQSVGRTVTHTAADRETLRTVHVTMVRDSLPKLASEIVSAGGMIPYLIQSKKLLKGAVGVEREPAQVKAGTAVFLTTVLLVTILGLLLGWMIVLTVYLTLGLAAVIWMTVSGVTD